MTEKRAPRRIAYEAVCITIATVGACLVISAGFVGSMTRAQGTFGYTLIGLIVLGIVLCGVAAVIAAWCHYSPRSGRR